MSRIFYFSIFFAVVFSSLQANEEKETPMDVDTISRAVGHVIARQFEQPGFAFNFEKVIEGMHEAHAGKESPMTDVEIEQVLASIQEKVFLKSSQENLAKATAFLEKNKTKEGVVTLEEKLQYEIKQVGIGEEVAQGTTPLIHYKGTLLDGTVFGNSYDIGQPITLPLSQTIQGFAKGITGMREGEKRTLYIHPDLGYGVNGHLPPNSLLIFEVEVMQANLRLEEPLAQE